MSCRWGWTSSSVVNGANTRVKQLFNRRLTEHTQQDEQINLWAAATKHWLVFRTECSTRYERSCATKYWHLVPHSMNNVAIQTERPSQVSCPRPRCCCSHELNVLLTFCPIYKLPALKGIVESYLTELGIGHRHVPPAVCCLPHLELSAGHQTEAVSGPLPHHRSAPQPVSGDLPNKVNGR